MSLYMIYNKNVVKEKNKSEGTDYGKSNDKTGLNQGRK